MLTRERDKAREERNLWMKEYDRLTAEVSRLKAGGCARDQRTTQYCAEAMALQREVERLTRELDETRREAAQWQESCGQNYVRATEAEMALEKVERERDEARAEVARLQRRESILCNAIQVAMRYCDRETFDVLQAALEGRW